MWFVILLVQMRLDLDILQRSQNQAVDYQAEMDSNTNKAGHEHTYISIIYEKENNLQVVMVIVLFAYFCVPVFCSKYSYFEGKPLPGSQLFANEYHDDIEVFVFLGFAE